MGLPRAHRLKERQDFQVVFRHGICRQSPHLILRGIENCPRSEETANATQIGISIGKKVSKKATVRNRIKRQIRAALRELLPKISPGWKIVIVVRTRATECKYEHFLRELRQLLKEAEVIN